MVESISGVLLYDRPLGVQSQHFEATTKRKVAGQKQHKIQILQNLEGLVEAGEMLVVLGPPGSGCSTFLKTIAGETYGFHVDKYSTLNFQGMLY